MADHTAPRGKKSASRTRPSAPPAPDARAAALALLNGCLRKGRALDEHFDAAAADLTDRDRAFARLLTATTLRRLGQIDAVLARYLTQEPPALTRDILRLGAAQLLFIGTPAHAAVATSVATVKRGPQAKFAGLVNAVLRRLAAAGPSLLEACEIGLNTPSWLRERWTAHYGSDVTAQLTAAHLIEAPIDLTVRDEAAAADWAIRLGGTLLPTGSIRLADSARIETLAGFADGAWWVQDAAAALPARILLAAMGGGAGRTVADLCAAPGGKTLQLAAAGCDVTAVDISAPRLARLEANLARTRLAARVVKADIARWEPEAPLDGVLLDAPCSSTGTIRRHPDLPYLKSAEDIARLSARQRALSVNAARLLKPGGVMVYSVCSLEPEEGERIVDAVLAESPGLRREPVPMAVTGGFNEVLNHRCDLRTLPFHAAEQGGMDGFYAAVLRKGS